MNFSEWVAIKEGRRDLASAYKSRLVDVPQDPNHHPEGDVLTHVKMVRKAIPRAVRELQSLQANHPQLSHVLSNIDFSITPEEMEILSMSAWLHDIGKATSTTIDGKNWSRMGPNPQGKIQAIGHQDPKQL